MPWAFRAASGKLAVKRTADVALLRFAAVGLATTTLDFVLFNAFTLFAEIPPILANVVSYSCGLVASFLLNRFWTFGLRLANAPIVHQAARFLAASIVGLTISSGLISALLLVLPPIAAKAMSIPLVLVWNYALARLWVFKDPTETAPQKALP